MQASGLSNRQDEVVVSSGVVLWGWSGKLGVWRRAWESFVEKGVEGFVPVGLRREGKERLHASGVSPFLSLWKSIVDLLVIVWRPLGSNGRRGKGRGGE